MNEHLFLESKLLLEKFIFAQSTEDVITTTSTSIKSCSLFSVYYVLGAEGRALGPVMQAMYHFICVKIED